MRSIPLFKRPTFDKNSEAGSSALVVDIRNSTETIRNLSEEPSFNEFTNVLMKIKIDVYNDLVSYGSPDSFAFNDTGDGFLFVMWDKKHTWTALRAGLKAYEVINKTYFEGKLIEFGIGIHCGGCVIYRVNNDGIPRDFIYGIVVNSASRLETYTKSLVKTHFLMTGHFKDNLYSQDKELFNLIENNIHCVSTSRVLIRDSKENGHNIYTFKNLSENNSASAMLRIMRQGMIETKHGAKTDT